MASDRPVVVWTALRAVRALKRILGMDDMTEKLEPITDKAVLAEAARRLNAVQGYNYWVEDDYNLIYIQALARALIEFGWKPPVDMGSHMNEIPNENWQFKIGDMARKKSGSAWYGRVVGYYSTTLTPEGYAVESVNEPGSVQIYPIAALKAAGDVDQDLLDLRELVARHYDEMLVPGGGAGTRGGDYDHVLPLNFYKSLVGKK